MKSNIIVFLLFLPLFSIACGDSILVDSSSCKNESQLSEIHSTQSPLVQTVYICGGNYAYAYHSIQNCPGLNNCQGGVYYTTESDAINTYRRVPCCRCWNNVAGNCKDDNKSVCTIQFSKLARRYSC